MYTHKVNIQYYNVYTSFWDTCISKDGKEALTDLGASLNANEKRSS
jgi:hypothetical protein